MFRNGSKRIRNLQFSRLRVRRSNRYATACHRSNNNVKHSRVGHFYLHKTVGPTVSAFMIFFTQIRTRIAAVSMRGTKLRSLAGTGTSTGKPSAVVGGGDDTPAPSELNPSS